MKKTEEKGKEEFEEGKEVECKKKIKLKSSLLTNSVFFPFSPKPRSGLRVPYLYCISSKVRECAPPPLGTLEVTSTEAMRYT